MELTLYSFTGKDIKLDKKNYLTKIIELNGTLKNTTSVLSPNFLVDMRDGKSIVDGDQKIVIDDDRQVLVTGMSFDVLKCNYCYCEEFKRWYFITDIQMMNNRLANIVCRIDVLMTYKENILQESGYIARNENTYNKMILDQNMQLEDDYEITFDKDIDSNHKNIVFTDNPTQNIVFNASVVWSSDLSDVDFYPMPVYGIADYNLPTINESFFNAVGADRPVMISYKALGNIVQAVKKDDTIKSYIKNASFYPFNIDEMVGAKGYLRIGSLEVPHWDDPEVESVAVCHVMESRTSPYLIYSEIDFSKYDLDSISLQYDKWDLYVPFYGFVDLDLNKLKGSNAKLVLYYVCDWTNGESTAFLYDARNSSMYWSSPVQLAIPVTFDSTNEYENAIQKQNATTQMVLGNISGAVGLFASILATATGVGSGLGIAGIAGSITGLLKTNVNYANNLNKIIDKGSTETSSSMLALFNQRTPFIRKATRKRIIDSEDTTYRSIYGKPLFETKKLNDLTGFTIVNDIVLKNNYGTKTEHDEVYSLLRSGFII